MKLFQHAGHGRQGDEMMEAYNTGYEAAKQGEPSSANPYPDRSWDSEQWAEGWADAMEWYS